MRSVVNPIISSFLLGLLQLGRWVQRMHLHHSFVSNKRRSPVIAHEPSTTRGKMVDTFLSVLFSPLYLLLFDKPEQTLYFIAGKHTRPCTIETQTEDTFLTMSTIRIGTGRRQQREKYCKSRQVGKKKSTDRNLSDLETSKKLSNFYIPNRCFLILKYSSQQPFFGCHQHFDVSLRHVAF